MDQNPYKSPPEFPPAGWRDASSRPTWVRWQLIMILMGFSCLNHFHRQSLPAVIHSIMSDCRFSETDMGWIFSAFLLGYVLFMVAGGWLADWRGGKSALVISGLGTAILVFATGICGYITIPSLAFIAFLLVRFPMGMLTTPLFPAAGRIAHAWIPFSSRGWANGLVLGATTIGVSAAPIVFAGLSDLLTWQLACVLMGVITALLTCVWAVHGRDRPGEHPAVNEAERKRIGDSKEMAVASAGLRDFGRLLLNPSLLLLTLNYAAVGYYEYTLFYWMKYYFTNQLHYEEQTSRYYTSIVTFAMVIAMPLGGVLSDFLVKQWGYRWGRAAVPMFGMLASAGLLYAATQVKGEVAVVALFFLAHAAIGLCEAPTWVAALEIGGKSCGTSAAIVNTGGNLGGLVAPVVTIYVAKTYGWNAGFLVASIACLLGVLLWLGVRLKHPDHQGDKK